MLFRLSLLCLLTLSLCACASATVDVSAKALQEEASLRSQPSKSASQAPSEPVFTHGELTEEIKEQMRGVSWQEDARCPSFSQLSLLQLSHLGFDGQTHTGQMVVRTEIAAEVCEIFRELYEKRFPIEKIRLIDDYSADDSAAMADNNTSAFCFRVIDGTKYLSNHSFGLAIDINPVQNPYLRGELVEPESGGAFLKRDDPVPGMITPAGDCYNAFVSRGWEWGGDWSSPVDYQHFEKKL